MVKPPYFIVETICGFCKRDLTISSLKGIFFDTAIYVNYKDVKGRQSYINCDQTKEQPLDKQSKKVKQNKLKLELAKPFLKTIDTMAKDVSKSKLNN